MGEKQGFKRIQKDLKKPVSNTLGGRTPAGYAVNLFVPAFLITDQRWAQQSNTQPIPILCLLTVI
jgi:hypothetical protein